MEFSELIKTATVENVLLSCAGLPAVKGTLCITSHHLLLSSCPGGDAQPGTVELWLLIRNVDAVEKRWALSSVDSVMMMYPFFYRPQSLKLEEGWHLFPLEQYFQQIASQLFLVCVGQLSRQFPFSLEFSERLLLALFDNAYASAYGTFLCNNEKERCLCKVKESTHSLWAWLNQPGEKKKYLNPLYLHNALVIWPSVEPQSIQLWQGLFFRWIRSSQYLDEAWAEIQRLAEGMDNPAKESAGNGLSRSLSDPAARTENER
nr:PREDICTED: myotubularin-related protein 9-like [Opisthocomus hoazin]